MLLAVSFFLMLGVGLGTSLGVITLWAVVGRLGLGLICPRSTSARCRACPTR